MANVILRHWLISLMLGLVAFAALAACSGDDPTQDAGRTAPETATDEPETAEARTEQRSAARSTTDGEQTESSVSDDLQDPEEEASQPSASDTPQAGDESTESALTLDHSTSWRDVYETLTESEQACIREQLGDEAEAVLAQTVLDDDSTQSWHVQLFSCLEPETGRELLLRAVLVGMADEGLELSEEATVCLREVLAGVDPAAVMAAAQEDGPEVNEFTSEVWRCLPELLLESIAAEIGVDLYAASEAELVCLREWAGEPDAVALMDEGDELALMELFLGVFRCSPSLLLASFGDLGAELDSDAEACLSQLLHESEASDLLNEGSPEYERFYAELLICLPNLSQVTGATSAASAGSDAPDSPDDHADSLDGSTAITLGVEVSGELGSDYDSDYFVFEAEQGVLYEINVGLVTLGDSVLTLYDGEWRQLAFSDDHADTLASRLYWLAEYTGEHYIEVWGYGLGVYTLLVEAR